jgi:hypothetical protein
MRRRAVLLGTLLPLLLVAIAGAQSLPSIPTDPAGARGSGNLCINVAGTGWVPCSAANPLQVGGITSPATQDVNVKQWGAAATTLGQKSMPGSVPVTMASDQSPIVTTPSGVATPQSSTPLSALFTHWYEGTGVVTTNVATEVIFLSDNIALDVRGGGGLTQYVSVDRGRTFQATAGTITNCPTPTSIATNGLRVLVGCRTGGGDLEVAFTDNAGLTWTTNNFATPGGVEGICSVGLAGTTAIAATLNGMYRNTSSGTGAWTLVSSGSRCTTTGNHNAIRIGSSNWVVATTVGMQISSDDGLTWATATGFPTATSATRLAAVSSTILLGVAQGSATLYRSVDGGATWTSSTPFSGASIGGIAVTGSTVVVTGIASGTVFTFRSTDLGLTWPLVNLRVSGGCYSGSGYMCSTAANSIGDVIETRLPNGGTYYLQYSPVLLVGQVTLAGEDDTLLKIDANGFLTANQGTAAAGTSAWSMASVQGATLFNTSATGAANTAVVATVTGAASKRTHLYGVTAFCSAGSASIIVADGVTTIWQTPAGAVGTGVFSAGWTVGLTATTAANIVVTLSTCGAGNTGTLSVQADRF